VKEIILVPVAVNAPNTIPSTSVSIEVVDEVYVIVTAVRVMV